MSIKDLEPGKGFDIPDLDDWRARAEKTVRGALDDALASETPGGLRLKALYTQDDINWANDPAGRPGLFPHLRGGRVKPHPWTILVTPEGENTDEVNTQALAALEGAATGLRLKINGKNYNWLYGVLEGVYVEYIPLSCQPGSDWEETCEGLLRLVKDRDLDASKLTGSIGADPLGVLAETAQCPDEISTALSDIAGLVGKLEDADCPLRAMTVDTHAHHLAGASAEQEMAAGLATALAYLRGLEEGGIKPYDAAKRIGFRLAAGPDLFLTVAKFRAFRGLWSEILAACDVHRISGCTVIEAVTSDRTLSRCDPWTNILRTAAGAMGAALGQADAIEVRPYTGPLGRATRQDMRIARNIQILLQEESHLARVLDPAGGSYALEAITEKLARTAWNIFQSIESQNGMEQVLTGSWWQAELARTAAGAAGALARNRRPLVGTSRFADLDEKIPDREGASAPPEAGRGNAAVTIDPLPAGRLAAPFEALRDAARSFRDRTGNWPQVVLATLGPLKDHGLRLNWTRDMLAAGGMEASVQDIDTIETEASSVAILVGADDAYEQQAEDALAALTKAGFAHVMIAGGPKKMESALAAKGLTRAVRSGDNIVEVLEFLHEALRVSA